MMTTDVLHNTMIIYALGIFTPNTDWILFTLVALYTHVPPRSMSLTMDTSILHFCASSFCVSFFSHRAFRIASLVALATYLVFFALSSVPVSVLLFAVIAATTADAEFLVVAAAVAVAASLYEPAVEVGFDLLNVTGVQSWQSGACVSAALYRFR